MGALPIYDETPRAIVGTESVNDRYLAYRLGGVSHRVWRWACSLRDKKTGELWDTYDLQRLTGLNDRRLKRTFAQLRRFGLISIAERRVLEIRGKLQVFYVRKIYGAPARHAAGASAIPTRTSAYVEESMGRGGKRKAIVGGKRPGAGRKLSGAADVLAWTIWPSKPVQPSALVDDGISKMGPPPRAGEACNVAESLTSGVGTKDALSLLSLSSDLSLRFTQREKPSASEGSDSFSSLRQPLPLAQRHPVSMGAEHPLVPRQVFVGHEVPLRIPHPPKELSKELPGRRAYLLSRWLEGAYEQRTGKRYWGFRSEKVPHITQSKHYQILLEASEQLDSLGISPAAWAAWSVNIWMAYAKQARRPVPVAWVFGKNRIREREGWFRSEQQDYSGGRLVTTDRARAFMRAQAEMRREFSGLSKDCSEAEILSVVSQYFPRGFDQELQLLKDETKVLEDELLDRLTCGDWIWNPRAKVVDNIWVWR